MSEKIKQVSEKTFIPLSLVFVILAAMYVYHKDMASLSERLARVEGKLGIYYAENK